jgi:hypothetical protein
MTHLKIIKKIEDSANHFLSIIKTEAIETKEATIIIQKYLKEGSITEEEEKRVKQQMIDSLKLIGVVVPFVLIPGASILMPILIKVANKHNIQLLPSSFNKKEEIKKVD